MPRLTIKSLQQEITVLRKLREGDKRSTEALQKERNGLVEQNQRGQAAWSKTQTEINFLRDIVTKLAEAIRIRS